MTDTENMKFCLKNQKNTSLIKRKFQGNGNKQSKKEILNIEFDNPLSKLPRASENINLSSRNKRRKPKIQHYMEPYVNKAFKMNKKILNAFIDLSVGIHSEMDTEFCVD